MALLDTQLIIRAAIDPEFTAISASDTFVPDGRTFLYYKITGTASVLTFVVPEADPPMVNYTISFPASTADRVVGPFPAGIFADPDTGLATVTATVLTGITVACFQVTRRHD